MITYEYFEAQVKRIINLEGENMGKIINIGESFVTFNRINDEDETLLQYISAIKEYVDLIYSHDSDLEKLLKSLDITERIKPLFLNKIIFIEVDKLNENEKIVLDILLEINIYTEYLTDLLTLDIEKKIDKKTLDNSVNLYIKKIIELCDEYRLSMKKCIKKEMIDEVKKSSKNI